MRLVIIGIWACIVTLASSYATGYIRSSSSVRSPSPSTASSESRKTKEINIPKIRDGVVKGYVVAQFSYDVDPAALKRLLTSPDAFVVDEAFREIYNDDSIDFSDLRKVDLASLTNLITKNVNTRLKESVIVDVTVQELTFLSKDQAEKAL